MFAIAALIFIYLFQITIPLCCLFLKKKIYDKSLKSLFEWNGKISPRRTFENVLILNLHTKANIIL